MLIRKFSTYHGRLRCFWSCSETTIFQTSKFKEGHEKSSNELEISSNYWRSENQNLVGHLDKGIPAKFSNNLVPRVHSAFEMAAERSRHLESGVDPGNEVDFPSAWFQNSADYIVPKKKGQSKVLNFSLALVHVVSTLVQNTCAFVKYVLRKK